MAKIDKATKEKFLTAGKKYKKILDLCKGDYDLMMATMSAFYKQITSNELTDEEFEELNKRYNLLELAESTALQLKNIKAKRGLGFNRNFVVTPEIYIYDKAPNGMVFGLTLWDYRYDKKMPISIHLFVEREGK